jgi:hypothetical protein
MRRWLLVVFVLQLCWNMAGFAVMGLVHEHPPSDDTTVAMSVVDAHANDAKGLADQAHGLLDEVPDLPDSLLRWSAPKWAGFPTPRHAARILSGRAPPLPEALFRPPPQA